MKTGFALTLLAGTLAGNVGMGMAAEYKVVETDKGIYVEYTGEADAMRRSNNNGNADTVSGKTEPAPKAKPDTAQVKALSGKIQQLKKEADAAASDAAKTEASDTQAKEKEAAEKKRQIEKYAADIEAMTGEKPNLNLLYNNGTGKGISRRGKYPEMPSRPRQ